MRTCADNMLPKEIPADNPIRIHHIRIDNNGVDVQRDEPSNNTLDTCAHIAIVEYPRLHTDDSIHSFGIYDAQWCNCHNIRQARQKRGTG